MMVHSPHKVLELDNASHPLLVTSLNTDLGKERHLLSTTDVWLTQGMHMIPMEDSATSGLVSYHP